MEPRSSGESGVGDIRAHMALTNCFAHSHLAHSHHPPPRTQPTFRGTEKHLPHGPFQVLSLWLEGTEHSKPLQQWPAFPKAPAQLVYRTKGGGKGYRPDVPSLGQAHGVHGLHSCLNGSHTVQLGQGEQACNEGRGLKYSRAERRLIELGSEHP